MFSFLSRSPREPDFPDDVPLKADAEAEKKALAVLKEQPISKGFHERYLYICLLSRDLRVDSVGRMLDKYNGLCKDTKCTPSHEWTDTNTEIVQTGTLWIIPGSRSIDGHGIIYSKPAKMDFAKHGHEKLMNFVLWYMTYGMFHETEDLQRRGAVLILDFSEFSVWQVDLSFSKYAWKMQNTFPIRIKKILIINGSRILSYVLSVARMFVAKKLCDRIQHLPEQTDLLKYIDEDNLDAQYGGKREYSIEKWEAALRECAKIPPAPFSEEEATKIDEQPSQSTTAVTTAATPETTPKEAVEKPSSDVEVEEKETTPETVTSPASTDEPVVEVIGEP